MNKTLAILGMLVVLFGATLHANSAINASAVDAARTAGRRMAPPILSQLGPKVQGVARPVAPAPMRITPVHKGPGETFAPTAADWAVYMHDSCHSGAISANAASNLTQGWTYVTPNGGVGAFCGSPVESDSIVCFTVSDGYLYAINRSTGADAWAPVLLGANGFRSGTPVIWQDRVVAGMYTGTGTTTGIFCRSMANGDSLWTTAIPSSPNQWMVHFARPIVLTVSGTAYVFFGCMDGTASAARVIGLNMTTGALVYDQQWTANMLYGGLATDGTNLYVPLQTTGLIKIVPATPPGFTTVWTQTPGPGANPVMSTPVYCNGQVFAADGATTGPESLYAINASTGVISWIRQVGNGTMGLDLGSATVDAANVYMFASNFSTPPYTSQIMAYHQSDGGDAWSTYYTTTDGLNDGGMAVTTGTNKRLYLGTGFGATHPGHMIALNAADGSLSQDLPYATDYIYNSVCRPYGGLYILTYGNSASGTLIGYSVNDGVAAGVDVGVTTITAPGAIVTPGTPIQPHCIVTNFGTTPQSGIPVTCWIDSASTHVYSSTGTITGPVAPGDTGSISFSTMWTPGNGPSYQVTMFTSLSGDTTISNDTARQTTTAFLIMDTLVAPFATTVPAIDGVINSSEWSDALRLDVSDIMGEEGAPVPAGSAFLYCKHDSGYVYYAYDLPTYTGQTDYDQFGCYLDENHDRAWAADSSEGNHWFVYLGGMDTTIYRASPSYWTRWAGPPPNGICASTTTSGHLQFEGRVSKGSNKWDYTISSTEDTVGFYTYAAVGGGSSYLGHWPTMMPGASWDDPTAYGTLILSQNLAAVHENPPVLIPASKLTLGSNPMTGSALVRYSVGRPGMVSLRLYDISGKLVSTLARSQMAAGNYQTTVDASKLAHGVYLLKFATDTYTTTDKLVIE